MQIEVYASRCANRIPVGEMRFDPATLIMIFTQVLPLLMSCLQNRVSEPSPAQMKAYIADNTRTDKQRRKLQSRMAGRIRGRAEEKMSKDEAMQLADAVITESLAGDIDDTEVVELMAACAAVGDE